VQGWSLPGTQDEGVESIPVEPREQLVQELSAFVAALRSNGPMPVTASDGLAALAIADALTESARSGLPVVPARE
jgi:predicted dehydrogenase